MLKNSSDNLALHAGHDIHAEAFLKRQHTGTFAMHGCLAISPYNQFPRIKSPSLRAF